ncbi:site-specific DNA-methyltransferase [Antarcticibacterium arcticum]|uniref:Site-specific DNA-methyltransferase n=1 Tax=Antarcticibacterium arcticum TaxID=2585771 RepID=A0A5B8YK03_9FLAO|nr:DNA methyltransferase [Antarcticibacterium arcticum]QED36706.1 site-specific DNA-methyltransferase [Antarcticibacterium arcticum]
MTNNYDKLQKVLTEVFQLDKAELDFGIYRIMNQKRNDVEKFLTEKLPLQVRSILEQYNKGDTAELQKELDKTVNLLKDAGVDPYSSSKVKELKSKIENGTSIDTLEQDVFSHLASFFKRYYKEGDFISLRRYKKDVYAIPYEGEEVKLHWANHDQYYIKTSEYLKNYAFKLPGDKTVKFELKEASTEQNNNKASKDKERRFALYTEDPVTVKGNTLVINFTYEPQKKAVKQDALIEKAIKELSGKVPQAFHEVFTLKPTEKNKKRILLEKHINDYTARNSFDYFIHKDLGGFLRRELDFYIKNEVLFIDDINTEDEVAFGTQISKIKALKQVAGKIITFLEQLENFQKKLWLKKKFVVSSNYCITLDRVPEEYYPEILKNEDQLKEWERIFDIKVKDLNGLKSEPFLVLDTKFFSPVFKDKLLADFDDLDEEANGLLINSENFQALGLIEYKYRNQIKGIYVDPPYNAKSSEIIYKNTFKHSSWLSFIENRISRSKRMLKKENGIFTIAIDENEQEKLGLLLSQIFPGYAKDCITIVHNASGQQGENFSYTNEFAYFLYPPGGRMIGLEKRDLKNADTRNLRDVTGEDSKREAAANCFYPILVKNKEIVGFGEVCADNYHPEGVNILREDGIIEIYPIDPQGVERKWRFARQTVERIKDELSVSYLQKREIYDIKRTKIHFNFKTVWTDSKYFANNQGTQILNNIIGKDKFSFPKSLYTVMDSIRAIEFGSSNPYIMDYFSGSGTTGHAVIALNREDSGNRKFILIEMGEYFNSVTKPRIQKVIYSDNWKNGKPQDKKGISQMFKYMSLESYEDALNNLVLQKDKMQRDLLSGNEGVEEEYLLKYMLDVESRGHLFNLEAFKNPFNYQLKVTENNELIPTTVDLVETFNYLLGLHVKRIQRIGAYKTVEGTTNKGDKVLVIWRNLEETDNSDLERFVNKAGFSILDGEFDTIYVNGDNNLANFRKDEDNWKVLLTEEVFFTEMFDLKDV